MSTSGRGAGVLETVRDIAPALTGNPLAVWHAARQGTQRAAEVLPDAMGLNHVKDFVRRHPIVSACAVLAVGYYFLGGRLLRGRR